MRIPRLSGSGSGRAWRSIRRRNASRYFWTSWSERSRTSLRMRVVGAGCKRPSVAAFAATTSEAAKVNAPAAVTNWRRFGRIGLIDGHPQHGDYGISSSGWLIMLDGDPLRHDPGRCRTAGAGGVWLGADDRADDRRALADAVRPARDQESQVV